MAETKRPGFLTVLCILSYIGCGFAVIGGLLSITTIAGIVSLVAALLCLYGVIQMWNLKKMGFYLYLVGEIVPVIVSVVTIGFASLFSFAGGIFALIAGGLGLILALAFIIMYALNLKHMH